MDFWSSYSSRQEGVTLQSLLDFTPLSAPKKAHLTKVYAMIFSGVIASAIGVYLHLHFLRLPSILLFLIKIGCLMAIVMTRYKARMEGRILTPTRLGCFGGFSLALGMNMADYLAYVHYGISGAIVPTAFLGSIAIFGCFSAGALMAKERSYLFLGGILGSVMSYMMLLSLANIFFRSLWLNDLMLYVGIFLYVGFVVYDTQVTLADFDRGNRDFLVHALELYMDLAGIFIRLVKVMAQNEENRRQKRRDDDRSR